MSIDVIMAALTPIQIDTAASHGLSTGNIVVIMGVVGNDNANGTFTITVVDSDTFTLDGTTSSGIGTGGTVTLVTAVTVTAATNASPIVITTSGAHNLLSGNRVIISGILGNTRANGTWTITKVDATHFSLNGSVGGGDYTSGGTITQTQSDPADVTDYNPTTGTTSTEGVDALVLDSSLFRYFPFDSQIVFVLYNIVAVDLAGVPTGDWEIGYGYSLNSEFTLARTVVIASSETDNGGDTGTPGSLVDFSSGTKYVTLTPLE